MGKLTQFRQAGGILAACLLAYVGARLLDLAEGYWALISAILL